MRWIVLAAVLGVACATKPHIVLTVIDDHGWRDAGYMGSKIRTPTIDKFATTGLQLHQMYVQKVCSPTRTALMTGRYPHRMGMQTPFCGGSAEGLNLNETLLPAHLATAGYVSHAVGKVGSISLLQQKSY
jgi:arylsulfatase A-like enzyme